MDCSSPDAKTAPALESANESARPRDLGTRRLRAYASRVESNLEQRVAAYLDGGAWNEAVEAIITAHGPRLRGFIRAVVMDRVVADEVWAEMTYDVYRGVGSWDRTRPLLHWCWGIARNACRRHARARRRHMRGPAPGTPPRWAFSTSAAIRTPTPVWQTTPARDALDALRATITPDERALLVLRVDKQLSWRDIALVMHAEHSPRGSLTRREAALRKRFERLLVRLRALARQRGLLPP